MHQYDFFLAGIIQGSHIGKNLMPQDYRNEIKKIIKEKLPNRNIFCPVEEHRQSVNYSDLKALEVFNYHLEMANKCRCLIAFLPEASMGTAVEMWECHKAGIPILTITPMATNWIVRFCSTYIFTDLVSFEEFCNEENLRALGI